jgi:hypothetical protein
MVTVYGGTEFLSPDEPGEGMEEAIAWFVCEDVTLFSHIIWADGEKCWLTMDLNEESDSYCQMAIPIKEAYDDCKNIIIQRCPKPDIETLQYAFKNKGIAIVNPGISLQPPDPNNKGYTLSAGFMEPKGGSITKEALDRIGKKIAQKHKKKV